MQETARGLTTAQVQSQRAAHGSNVLTPPPRTPGWRLYLEKFDDPVIRILLIAAGIAIAVGAIDGHIAEGVGILVAVFLATYLAYWNESRAAREFDLLNVTSDDVPVKVLRDGSYRTVPRRDVVVGDVLFLETGEEVPADADVIEAVGLQVNEAKLTGESQAASKSATQPLFRGTTIVAGSGHATVTAVGDRTELGQTLRESITESGESTPLNRQLAKLSRIIGVVGFTVAALAFYALLVRGLMTGMIALTRSEWLFLGALGIGLHLALIRVWLPIVFDALELLGILRGRPSWLSGRAGAYALPMGLMLGASLLGAFILLGLVPAAPDEWLDRNATRQLLRNFMIAVTIIVVAVPEGLAMSVTLSLAYSMRKMTASNTLVRRLAACETIGAATVICCDKTGTLTQNAMQVAEIVSDGVSLQTLAEAMAVNSTAQLHRNPDQPSQPIGNPTEGALLLWLEEQGIDYAAIRERFSTTAQWSFSTERKFMATLGPVLHVKGAPEIVLSRCVAMATQGAPRPMTAEDRARLSAKMQELQSRGMRTLALAMSTNPDRGELDELATNLTWLGLVAIADPVRPEVPGAIAACRRAGVAVKIVTGDNPETAQEIARQIGMSDTPALTGPEFAGLDDATASDVSARLAILARARPADKLRLVRLLKARGEVVAVTGDGVNDGPALNYADVGLAMGKSGTAVAREASDIIILDDSFPSIVNAVRWGRALYENIQRFILFQLTINVAALALAVLGPFIGYELPLTVMQMLWVNLIMDTFAALALATEPPHDDVLTRPPRSPRAFIVTPSMARAIFGAGALFLIVLLGLILYGRSSGLLFNDPTPTRGSTILFTVFVLLQFWNLFNAKAFGHQGSVIPTLGNNPSFLVIVVVILAGQILLVQFGGQVFRTVPLSVTDWLVMLAATSPVLLVPELWRLVWSATGSRPAGALP